MTTTITDSSFCNQRTIAQIYNVPLPRFSLDSINPYKSGLYTKPQLDMRRKAEILKYSANASSTQTNNLTKGQRFALLARGRLPTPSQSALNAASKNGGVLDCSMDNMIPTPTSSCNVPGPVIYLYEDDSVPLYNYSNFNTRSYPQYVPDNMEMWQFISFPNVPPSGNLYYLILNRTVDQTQYVYDIVTPIELDFSGIVPSTNSSANLTIDLSNVVLNAFYNGNSAGSFPASNESSLRVQFRLSTNTTGAKFNAGVFMGALQFNGILLYTAPTYVYTFSLQYNFVVSSDNPGDPYGTTFLKNSNFLGNLVANTTILSNTSSNCVVSSTPISNPGPSLTAIV